MVPLATLHTLHSVSYPMLALLMAPREGGNAGAIFFTQLILFGAIFYFILLRPQRKEQQRHREVLKALAKGDRVMTNGGILGTIVHAAEHELTIKTGDNTRIVIDRGHIARKIVPEVE
ncbi:MAG: preprotein translocase subunit YajC [Longimicrobiales bacterium]